jgi:putative transposase
MHSKNFPIAKMCRVFKVSEGGYFSWLKRLSSQTQKLNLELQKKVFEAHSESNGVYGRRRVAALLKRKNPKLSIGKIGRMMNKQCLRG